MSDVNLSISKEVVEPIVRAKIESAVVEALGANPMQLIEGIVRTALNQRVDSDGKPTNYSANPTYVNWLATKMLRDATVAAVGRWVDANQPSLEKALVAQLNKNTSMIAASLAAGFSAGVKDKYGWKINVSVDSVQR